MRRSHDVIVARSSTCLVTAFRVLAAVAVLSSLTACGSGNKSYEQGMKTGANLQDLAKDIQAGEKQMDTTLAQADSLVNAQSSNPKKQFEQYRKSLKELQSTAADVGERADDMTKRSEAYFAQWEKDAAKIKNEDIRSVSVQRRNERAAQFNALKSHFGTLRDAFKPFVADLQDIEQALSVELTPGSMAALKPFVTKAKNDAVPLKNALNELGAEFQALGVTMSPTGTSKN